MQANIEGRANAALLFLTRPNTVALPQHLRSPLISSADFSANISFSLGRPKVAKKAKLLCTRKKNF